MDLAEILEFIKTETAGATGAQLVEKFNLKASQLSEALYELKKAKAIYGRVHGQDASAVTKWFAEKETQKS